MNSRSNARGTLPRTVSLDLLPVGLFLVVASLYLFGLGPGCDAGIYRAYDVVWWTRGMANAGGAVGWHPHHPLFHLVAWLVARWTMLFAELDIQMATWAYQAVSATGGATAVWLLYRFALPLCGVLPAIGIAALFALSYGNWHFASVGESFPCAVAATAGLLHAASARHLHGRPASTAALVSWLFLAVAFRQDSVLVLVPLALLVPWRRFVLVAGLAGGLALGLYVGAWIGNGTESGFFRWVTAFASTHGLGSTAPSGHQLALGVVRGLESLVATVITAPWLGLGTWLVCSVVFFPARRALGGRWRVLVALILFAALRTAFFMRLYPTEIEYHAATLLPLAMIAALCYRPGSRTRSLLLVVAVALVAVGNTVSFFIPFSGGRLERAAQHALARAGSEGIVIAMDANIGMALLRAHPGDRVIDGFLAPRQVEHRAAIQRRIATTHAAGGAVVIVRDTYVAGLRGPVIEMKFLEAFLGGRTPEVDVGDSGEPWMWTIRGD